jgi:PIN domain
MEQTSTPTSLELLDEQLDGVRAAVFRLLDHVRLRYYNPNDNVSGVVFIGFNPHRWDGLQDGGQRSLGEARRSWDAFYELASQAVRMSAPERTSRLEKPAGLLRRVIELDEKQGAPAATVDQIRALVQDRLRDISKLLHELPSAHGDGGRLLVPDTNALLFKPELADWRPPEGEWTVVLVPQVLRELDAIKMRTNDVGKKADGVIRRIKEYARRGDSFVGVSIAVRLSMREVAIDPDMSETLSWLQAGHGDDEGLAPVYR